MKHQFLVANLFEDFSPVHQTKKITIRKFELTLQVLTYCLQLQLRSWHQSFWLCPKPLYGHIIRIWLQYWGLWPGRKVVMAIWSFCKFLHQLYLSAIWPKSNVLTTLKHRQCWFMGQPVKPFGLIRFLKHCLRAEVVRSMIYYHYLYLFSSAGNCIKTYVCQKCCCRTSNSSIYPKRKIPIIIKTREKIIIN